jgi:plastocyanin
MLPVRLVPALALAGVLVILLAACSTGEAPGWTFAPTPSPTVAPSVAPSGSAAGSAAPSAPAGSAAPSATPSGGSAGGAAGGTVLAEVASGVAYATTTFQAPASQAFQITFDNQDSGIPHNIQIADGSGANVFEGDTVTGPGQITYNVPALAAGAYKFSCKWHPTMTGDLTVQ